MNNSNSPIVWPGASAQQVEEQVTDKIEKKLQDTPGLDYLRSYSVPGKTYIFDAIIILESMTVNLESLCFHKGKSYGYFFRSN
ncbi:MAG: hypothetical protein CVU90_14285 [Firmicutes bacterium HGW-Firmicutes-15]|nr:MAG: hypothetical protein CVU90_14285 [Firmicutes bacterium HGW-Firmicutes-15]